MGKKIYIGNLSYGMNDESLANLFTSFGSVTSARIVTDRESGRSKGFGFVEMDDEGAANTAIEKLNGTEQMGRTINVSEAKPMAPREGGGGGRGFGGGGRGGGRGGFGGGRGERY